MNEEKMRAEFKRERRYIVFKISDVEQLDAHQHRVLNNLCEAVQDVRQLSGKPELECVVVEKDWPEYELVWRMLEARMAGQATPPLPTDDDRVRELMNKYNELIMAVARKYPNETRHETALRYINDAEVKAEQAMKGETSWATT